jgi:uncharacterized protein (TIGR00255 family)
MQSKVGKNAHIRPVSPMILSMTGFAAVAVELPGVALAVELRSVNHRYLDLQVRLPDELRGLESTLRERLQADLKRGKVECRVALTRAAAGAAGLAVDAARVGQLAQAAAAVAAGAPGATPLSVGEILRWPGVLAEPTVPPEELAAHAGRLVTQALAELSASRAREGMKLVATLVERCAAIEAQVARVAPRIPAIHASYVDKLSARLREAAVDPDQDRLKQELALFATKIDVAEELSRLSTHIAEVRRVLAAGGSAGKRLDFLMQELHREANTLGSKSVDAELSQASLEIKVLVEQMREQVQNLE